MIADSPPRLDIPRLLRPDWDIYTDAASKPPMICALLSEWRRSSPQLRLLCSARVAVTWSYLLRWTSLIFGLGVLDLVLFSEDWPPFLRGSSCWIYLDNNNCLSSLVRWDSNTDVITVLVTRFWKLARRHDICASFPSVRSEINPSGLPTRHRPPTFIANRPVSDTPPICRIDVDRSWPSYPPKSRRSMGIVKWAALVCSSRTSHSIR